MLAGLLKAPSEFSPASNLPGAGANPQRAQQDGGGGLLTRSRRESAAVPPSASRSRQRESVWRRLRGRCRAGALPSLLASPEGDDRRRDDHRARCSAAPRRLVHDHMSNEGRRSNASQAGLDCRHGRRHPRAGRRALLRGKPVQSGAEGQEPAGLRVQEFVYLAALESGMRPTARPDLPILGPARARATRAAGYRGNVTLREALALSMNAAAARRRH